jgi:hypothetical protein
MTGSRSLAVYWRTSRDLISNRPGLYIPLARLAKPGQVVGAQTKLVIEGFPRCGNSFAEAAVRWSQGESITLAHHTHAAAHVIEAVRRSVPCLVLIRNPEDAVTSLVMLNDEYYSPTAAFRKYYRFYEAVAPAKSGFVLAPFDVVTRDFGSVLRTINRKYGTSFSEFEHTKEAEKKIFAIVDKYGMDRGAADPEAYSPARSADELRIRAEDKIARKAEICRSVDPKLVRRCVDIYQELLKKADVGSEA